MSATEAPAKGIEVCNTLEVRGPRIGTLGLEKFL